MLRLDDIKFFLHRNEKSEEGIKGEVKADEKRTWRERGNNCNILQVENYMKRKIENDFSHKLKMAALLSLNINAHNMMKLESLAFLSSTEPDSKKLL